MFSGNSVIHLVLLFGFGVLVQVRACSGVALSHPQAMDPLTETAALRPVDPGVLQAGLLAWFAPLSPFRGLSLCLASVCHLS